jgi:hypothetical protein
MALTMLDQVTSWFVGNSDLIAYVPTSAREPDHKATQKGAGAILYQLPHASIAGVVGGDVGVLG